MSQSMNIAAVARTMATKNFIDAALSGNRGLRVQSHMGDLKSVNGQLLENLDSTDLLLIELDADNREELIHLERIVQQQRGKTAIVVTAGEITTQGIRNLIRQGVDDFVPQPMEPGDLLDAIEGARIKLRRSRAAEGLGDVIAVSRAKGGMGATTVAIHTAIALLQKKRRRDPDKRVALLDFDLHFGDVGTLLDLKMSDSFSAILRDPSRLDEDLLRQAMTEHHSGIFVLQAPVDPVPLDALRGDTARRIIELAREEFDYVVIDLPLALPRWLEAVLQQSDHLMLVMQLNVPAIRQTKRFMQLISDEGLFDMPVAVVLNRYVWRLSERGRLKQAIKALGQPISHYLPNDYKLTHDAMDRGVSLFEASRRSKVCRAIQDLSKSCVAKLKERRVTAAQSAKAS